MAYASESMREKQLNVRLSAEEAMRLERVATHYGLNAAAVLRMLVKREHDALPPDLGEVETEILRVLGARRSPTDLRAALKQARSPVDELPVRTINAALARVVGLGYVEQRAKTHVLTQRGRERL